MASKASVASPEMAVEHGNRAAIRYPIANRYPRLTAGCEELTSYEMKHQALAEKGPREEEPLNRVRP